MSLERYVLESKYEITYLGFMDEPKNIQGLNLPVSQREIQQFCERWKMKELIIFGSILRDDFNTGSDIDLLVSFSDDAKWSLLDQVKMEEELEQLFGREVDLLSRKAVEDSENWIRRGSILSESQTIYAA